MLRSLDGKVELAAELDRLSAGDPVAAAAPRATGIAGYLTHGINTELAAGNDEGPHWRLTLQLLQRLSIWWSPGGYAQLPTMTPWCIRDRSARYDQGPESWGAPREDGYLRDDNSIIKKLPLALPVTAAADHIYTGGKAWRGFTACHIWRSLADGGVGGTDPWIYSFMANLVWIPSPLNSLTDHHPRVQALLQATSQAIFRGHEGAATAAYTKHVWNRLVPPGNPAPVVPRLNLDELAFFQVTPDFIKRRLAYLDKFVDGADTVLAGKPLTRKLICTRYTTGLPLLAPGAVQEFRTAMHHYAHAVRTGL